MSDDIFDDETEMEESPPPIVETQKVVEEVKPISKWDEEGNRPAMQTAKIFERMLSDSANLHNKQHDLDTKKLAKQAEFLDYANKNGFSPKDIVSLYQDAIKMAKTKGDSRALTRLTELVSKTMLEPANDMSKFFLQLQQNNFKMSQKGGDSVLQDATTLLNSLPEHVLKKFLADKLQEMLDNG